MKKAVFLILIILLAAVTLPAKPKSGGAYAFNIISREVKNTETGNILRGTLYMPEIKGKMPLIITAHEFGGNSRRGWWIHYAEYWAQQGIAVYTFDFSGGGEESTSDGKTTDMSVLTEAVDLEQVLASAREWNFVDKNRIVIIGGSQGGAVSSIVAARHPEDIAALVLLYPALIVTDDLHVKFPDPTKVPDVYRYNGWIDVGPRYVNDMYNFDIYKDMATFNKSVLLIHGDKDDIVPLSYSERAKETYKDAELVVIKGAGHIFFTPDHQKQCLDAADIYLKKMGIIK
ncbi:MAG: alpha/beta fold hydrolase [Spirochaetia bacterium]|nr:alpha/beta fold hydrolase [Spirochaetia bacterium]